MASNLLSSELATPNPPNTMATSILALPYHLRSPRLRWAALAIDLAESEVRAFKAMASDLRLPNKTRAKARMLLGLHQRVPLHDLCLELHLDRRTLFRNASELAERDQREAFIAAARSAIGA